MIVGISMVKDEADIVGVTVAHMRAHCDTVIVADNGSTDGTREILDGLDVRVIDDPEVGYYQSQKMSALAERARQMGATWIVPFDADEVWLSTGRIAEMLSELPAEADICEATLIDHVTTALDPEGDNPVETTPWRRAQQAPLRKVAVRAREGLVIHQGNHGASIPGRPRPLTVTGQLEIRHFPYRSTEQFIRKARNGAAAYAATDLPEDAGAHWRGYGAILESEGEAACAGIYLKWFHSLDPQTDELVFDPCEPRS